MARNTIWFGVADEISADTTVTTITLQDGVYVYPVSIETDTTLVFDTSELSRPGLDAEKWGAQFMLLLKMGATVYPVTFPSGIKWNCNIGPVMNAANKDYLVRFDTVGASVTVGNYDGSVSNA